MYIQLFNGNRLLSIVVSVRVKHEAKEVLKRISISKEVLEELVPIELC